MKVHFAFVVCVIYCFVANYTELNAQTGLQKRSGHREMLDSTDKTLGLVIRGSRASFSQSVIFHLCGFDTESNCFSSICVCGFDTESNPIITTVEPDKPSLSSASLTVYPNPTSDNINIEYPFRFIGKRKYLTIHSMIGELMISKEIDTENPSESVDVRALPTGMYIVRVSAGSLLLSSTCMITR